MESTHGQLRTRLTNRLGCDNSGGRAYLHELARGEVQGADLLLVAVHEDQLAAGDLHDGAQQQLVSLSMRLRLAADLAEEGQAPTGETLLAMHVAAAAPAALLELPSPRPPRLKEGEQPEVYRWREVGDAVVPLGPEPIRALVNMPEPEAYRIFLRHEIGVARPRPVTPSVALNNKRPLTLFM